jgi:hypothetical protein
MELLILLIVAGVIGFFIGRSRRPISNSPASQQTIEGHAREPQEVEKPTA